MWNIVKEILKWLIVTVIIGLITWIIVSLVKLIIKAIRGS